ncbi:hypothetical protein Acor_31730 [Acrocarpospora corrugata]|uniref:Integral membrane protein n=1 Tax=Acrocarpospora corrugata TaxID=35763 RepID=A0A5M3VYC7_9ACTN|nr:hypothetical protein [Acrocarpospora corrugata]GES01109.1 hypothetical protein Acor_31730 [Acrocarpospora corrugata]
MSGAYSGWVIGGALVLALACLITAGRNRPMGISLLAAVAVLEIALIVQAVMAFTQLDKVTERATFIGYLAGTLVIPLVALWWGKAERTRWGPGVIAVGAFTVAVMTGRLLQIWNGIS